MNQSFTVTPRPGLSQFQKDFIRLLTETIALGVEPDRALKYWSWIVEHEVRKGEHEDRRRVHDA